VEAKEREQGELFASAVKGGSRGTEPGVVEESKKEPQRTGDAKFHYTKTTKKSKRGELKRGEARTTLYESDQLMAFRMNDKVEVNTLRGEIVVEGAA